MKLWIFLLFVGFVHFSKSENAKNCKLGSTAFKLYQTYNCTFSNETTNSPYQMESWTQKISERYSNVTEILSQGNHNISIATSSCHQLFNTIKLEMINVASSMNQCWDNQTIDKTMNITSGFVDVVKGHVCQEDQVQSFFQTGE